MSEIEHSKNHRKRLLGVLLIGSVFFLLTSPLQSSSIILTQNSNGVNDPNPKENGTPKEESILLNLISNGAAWSFLGALIGGGIGSLATIYVSNQESNLKKRERLIESLTWFEGRTQKRNVGIAIVESEWEITEKKDFKEFKKIWTSLLVNQAIYLLTNEKDEIAFHEEQNLCRMIDILVEKAKIQKKESNFYRDRYQFLILAIEDHAENRESKKLKHLNEHIKRLGKNKKNWKHLINDEKLWEKFIGDKNSYEASQLLRCIEALGWSSLTLLLLWLMLLQKRDASNSESDIFRIAYFAD
ncbi:MAG: hypothetical protein QNJ33_10405 [Crocosphaera sp.]|nr:hypothetical protein [Crocosphaera sp.]